MMSKSIFVVALFLQTQLAQAGCFLCCCCNGGDSDGSKDKDKDKPKRKIRVAINISAGIEAKSLRRESTMDADKTVDDLVDWYQQQFNEMKDDPKNKKFEEMLDSLEQQRQQNVARPKFDIPGSQNCIVDFGTTISCREDSKAKKLGDLATDNDVLCCMWATNGFLYNPPSNNGYKFCPHIFLYDDLLYSDDGDREKSLPLGRTVFSVIANATELYFPKECGRIKMFTLRQCFGEQVLPAAISIL